MRIDDEDEDHGADVESDGDDDDGNTVAADDDSSFYCKKTDEPPIASVNKIGTCFRAIYWYLFIARKNRQASTG